MDTKTATAGLGIAAVVAGGLFLALPTSKTPEATPQVAALQYAPSKPATDEAIQQAVLTPPPPPAVTVEPPAPVAPPPTPVAKPKPVHHKAHHRVVHKSAPKPKQCYFMHQLLGIC